MLMHTRADNELDVTEWLLQAADDPARARAEWQTMDVALLRCGVCFTAIRVRADVVFAAARTEEWARVDAYLAAALHGGPVFVDRQSGWYYCLVPAGTCVDSSRYRARSSWCVPPYRPEVVCQADAVAQMTNLGRFLLAGAKETGDV
ncbi:hypothetical protein [Streptomyces fulvoviolaceus]|uniref:hypothetical protein n=1 Tax=Streptomyces fulvoviolaceus TaxID=285535 RepID=UPI0021BFD26E|nr:hypothetical protein [Streptomyces fulvoviolaceus]MCT9080294.1 hypothetical protein [Streptomyces fulvoviolaceus]